MTNVRLEKLREHKLAVAVFFATLLAALALGLALMAGPAGAAPGDPCEPDCGGGGGDTDTIPPDTTISSGPPSPTNQTSVTFSYSADEAPATFECRLDTPTSPGTYSACGGPTSATTDGLSKTYSGLTTNGTYTFYVRATDASNNTDLTPATRQFTLDTVAPSAPTINTRPPELVNSRTASWTFSSEPGATFLCSIDSTTSFSACSSGQSFTVSSDGLHTFRVKARDQAGNIGTYAEDSWTVDTTAPVVSIQDGPSGLTNNRSPSFTFSSTEAGSFQCSLSGPSSAHNFTTCTSPKSYSGLADGAYTFSVRAIDQAGNMSTATRSFTVDGTAPVVNITGGPGEGSTSNSRSPSFTFTASEAVSFFCKLDGAAEFTACSSPQEYSNLADGTHTFSVKGRDAAGNESTVQRSWTVDATPPSLSITSGPPDGAAFKPGSTQTWTFDAGDATSVQCKVVPAGGSGSYGPCNGANSSHFVTGLSEGSYDFWVRATDGVNNASELKRTFSIDATAPTVEPGSLVPGQGATLVLRTTSVSATFSEEMKADTLTSTTFKLQMFNKKKKRWKTIPTTMSLTLDNGKTTATLNPYGDTTTLLAANKKFRGFITGGTNGVKDAAGNSLASNFIWIFKTGSS